MTGCQSLEKGRPEQRDSGPGPPRLGTGTHRRRKGCSVKKQSETVSEARPATLHFRGGVAAGTIYIRRVGGRIVEAYRGYDFAGNSIAPILRSKPSIEPKL